MSGTSVLSYMHSVMVSDVPFLVEPPVWDGPNRARPRRAAQPDNLTGRVYQSQSLFPKAAFREGEAPAEPQITGKPARPEPRPPILEQTLSCGSGACFTNSGIRPAPPAALP